MIRKRCFYNFGLFLLCLISFSQCGQDDSTDGQESAPFRLLRQEQTGLDFRNTLQQSPEFNVFNYMYFYNGGGLAAGDFNQDGLPDLYFTSNMGDNKLFLNEGDLRFREAGPEAGLGGQPGWATGASVVDINQDGLLDIYVSQVGDYLQLRGSNQLYVCQGIENGVPVFKDEAAAYGLDLVGFGTQAAFFDYDLDGDLDLYQLNHSLHQNGTFGKRMGMEDKAHPLAGDKLLRNDDGHFTEVSKEAGILSSVVGYGLGIAVGDLNGDGWPDIYVGNDFHENDYLYLNNQDGTFRESLTEQIQHTSRFSMGVDIADINNDGNPEIISLDMLPEDPIILKSSLGEDGFDVFKFKLGFGYNPQFSRNTLQLNNGNGSFSEIGAFAGVHASDWSWGPLFFDMDHDGNRDLFISNGIPRRMNDIDYINFKMNDDLKYKESNNDIDQDDLSLIEKMPEIKLKNKFYHNDGNLRFTDISEAVEYGMVSYSSSAITADLDNDGDLDVVVNNIDDEPFIYQNRTQENEAARGAYLKLNLSGAPGNRNAIGATAVVFAGAERIVYEYFPTRGYQSSNLGPLHLGLGEVAAVDSMILIWPDRTSQRLADGLADTTISLTWRAGLPVFDFAKLVDRQAAGAVVEDVTETAGISYVHEENPFVDFNREPLIPHMVSSEGPALAVGDVNGDGREDFFVGSAKRKKSALYLQGADGGFTEQTPWAIIQDSIFEDVDAAFFDLENDGDLDLIIAGGGNEYFAEQEPRKQRLFVNDGRGNYRKVDAFPEVHITASVVLIEDVNSDGFKDVFFGARAEPWAYGKVPTSYLFLNQRDGTFLDATDEIAIGLRHVGMVKDGKWTDIDQDGDPDLILAAEWEPLMVFYNDDGKLIRKNLTEDTGWWNTVEAEDFDGDGDVDIIAGNLGANNKFRPTKATPLKLYVNDFDGNEKLDQVLTYFVKGKEVPFASHAELVKQLPSLKKRYLFAQDMAQASLTDIFGRELLNDAIKYEVNRLESVYLVNDGEGNFSSVSLPDQAQFSTIGAFAQLSKQEEETAWLIGGNFLGSNIEMGWYDASIVQVLKISAGGEMSVQRLDGARLDGEIRNMARISLGGDPAVLIARNNDALRLVKIK